jgi:hypothetical protein
MWRVAWPLLGGSGQDGEHPHEVVAELGHESGEELLGAGVVDGAVILEQAGLNWM